MFQKLSSAIGSLTSSASSTPPPRHELLPTHRDPARAQAYASLAKDLEKTHIPVDYSDCAACDNPCPTEENAVGNGYTGKVVAGAAWDGKSYEQYVLDKYGDLGSLPAGFETDWESELLGTGHHPPEGRVLLFSTGKSDWEKDHLDEKQGLAHKVHQHFANLRLPGHDEEHENSPGGLEASVRPPIDLARKEFVIPDLHSCSMISQSTDSEDVSVIVFPDWKVVHEVENSTEGAASLYDNVLKLGLGRAGRLLSGEDAQGVGRIRSWVMPYRAVVMLCSHKRRDKRCSIAAPLLRSALTTCLEKYDISVDGTGESLSSLEGKSLEMTHGSEAEREAEVERQREDIEGARGGNGGTVGIFNVNHIGQHKYSGVMLILFPSGAYLSYGRVSPQEIPRVVEETILQGKVVPGLLRIAVGAQRDGEQRGKGFLGW